MSRDVKPPTIEDVMRELGRPASPEVQRRVDAAERAYRDGRLHGALIRAARMARVAWACDDVGVMTDALVALSAAELAAGVDLTSPTDEDLR